MSNIGKTSSSDAQAKNICQTSLSDNDGIVEASGHSHSKPLGKVNASGSIH